MHIPFMDLKRQYETIKPQIDSAIQKIVETTEFIGGPTKEKFEKDFAEACGSKFCLGVGNGTDAITIALKAMGVGPGDEVVTQANTFISSAEAITMAGARPVFVDCDAKNFLMDTVKLEALLEKRAHTRGGKIKALIPVHLYGQMTDMTKVMSLAKKYDLKVLEDCAQAHLSVWEGKRAGSIGDVATFSFYPGKNLGAFGDAGAITTNNEAIYTLAKKIANHGRIKKYDHDMEGYNSRLDALQAAVLSVKLQKLQAWSDSRYDKAVIYNKELKGLEPHLICPEIPPKGSHVFHLYVLRVKEREKLQSFLKEKGIDTSIHYPIALPNLKAYEYLGHKPADFPVASEYQETVFSLPLFPEMTASEQTYICENVRQFFKKG